MTKTVYVVTGEFDNGAEYREDNYHFTTRYGVFPTEEKAEEFIHNYDPNADEDMEDDEPLWKEDVCLKSEGLRKISRISPYCSSWTETEAFYIGKEEMEIETSWIPTSERMPEEDGTYLCTVCEQTEVFGFVRERLVSVQLDYERNPYYCEDDNRYGIFFTVDGNRWDNEIKNVTAWMPMPEPYEGR